MRLLFAFFFFGKNYKYHRICESHRFGHHYVTTDQLVAFVIIPEIITEGILNKLLKIASDFTSLDLLILLTLVKRKSVHNTATA